MGSQNIMKYSEFVLSSSQIFQHLQDVTTFEELFHPNNNRLLLFKILNVTSEILDHTYLLVRHCVLERTLNEGRCHHE